MTQQPVGAKRPGGRAARVRTAVLHATGKLLDEVGYDEVTIDEIAARAGVHKTTIYRRWPSKADLIADAAGAHSDEHVPIPDSGSLAGDLQALARSVVANIGSESGARRSRSIAAAATGSAELAAGMQQFWADRLELSGAVVRRAIERGELPGTANPKLIIEALIGPLWVRVLLTGEPVTVDLADRVAELVTKGAMATDTSSAAIAGP